MLTRVREFLSWRKMSNNTNNSKLNIENKTDLIGELNCKNSNASGSQAQLSTKEREETNSNSNAKGLVLVHKYLEQRDWTSLVQEGYIALGRYGAVPILYKCIIIGLVKLNKLEEVLEVLNTWKRCAPKDAVMIDVRQRFEKYFNAIRSGISAEEVFGNNNIESVLGIDTILSKQIMSNDKFRPPPEPVETATFYLCPRSSNCIFGEKCRAAHSKEELTNWINIKRQINKQKRLKENSNSTSPISSKDVIVGNNQFNKDSDSKAAFLPKEFRFKSQSAPAPLDPEAYLAMIKKRIYSTQDLSTLFRDSLPDVTFKCNTKLNIYNCKNYTWTLGIGSKQPLRRVALITDECYDNFYIKSAKFLLKEYTEVLDLFELGINQGEKLKVLTPFVHHEHIKSMMKGAGGAWPECFYYKIEIAFEATEYGNFKQNIVLDFKYDPKILKHLTVSQRPVICSETGIQIDNYIFNNSFGKYDEKPLDIHNYQPYLGEFIQKEQDAKELELAKYDMITDLKVISSNSLDKNNPFKNISEKTFCIVIVLKFPITEDVKSQLVLQCDSVHIALEDKTYACQVIDRGMKKNSLTLSIGRVMMMDLNLNEDSIIKGARVEFKSEMSLNSFLKLAIEKSPSISNILFPDFNRNIDTPNIVGLNDQFDFILDLDNLQLDAYRKIISNDTFMSPILLLGSFCTGKSYTFIQAMKKLLKNNKKLLVCTSTESTADLYFNILNSWIDNNGQKYVKPLRITRKGIINDANKDIKTFYGGEYKYKVPTKEDIKKHNFIVCNIKTIHYLSLLDLELDPFNYIFLDEASNALEYEFLQPLILARSNFTKIILAGDIMQLPPESYSIRQMSLLERLYYLYPDSHPCKIYLTHNYTTHSSILEFSSYFYKSKIKSGAIQLVHPMYYPLSFFNVDGVELRPEGSNSFYNMAEVIEIVTRVSLLIKNWPANWGDVHARNALCIVTWYQDQINRIQSQLQINGLEWVKVDRICNLKERKFRAVFISIVRTEGEEAFFSNERLINVSVGMAYNLVAVVGNLRGLTNFGSCREYWKKYITLAQKNKSLYGLKEKYHDDNTNFAEQILNGIVDIDKKITNENYSSSSNISNNMDNHYKQNFPAIKPSNLVSNETLLKHNENKLNKLNIGVIGKVDIKNDFNEFCQKTKSESSSTSVKNVKKPTTGENKPKAKPNNIANNSNNGSALFHQTLFEKLDNLDKEYSNESIGNNNEKKGNDNSIEKKGSKNKKKRSIEEAVNPSSSGENTSDYSISPEIPNFTESMLHHLTKPKSAWMEVKSKTKVEEKKNDGPSSHMMIEYLVNMGFDKKQAIKALQCTNKDLHLAIDLLLSKKPMVYK